MEDLKKLIETHNHNGLSSASLNTDYQNSAKWAVNKALPTLFFSDNTSEQSDSTTETFLKDVLYSDVNGTITIKVTAVSDTAGGNIIKIYQGASEIASQTVGTAPAVVISVDATVATGDHFKVSVTATGANRMGTVSNFQFYGGKVSKPTNITLVS